MISAERSAFAPPFYVVHPGVDALLKVLDRLAAFRIIDIVAHAKADGPIQGFGSIHFFETSVNSSYNFFQDPSVPCVHHDKKFISPVPGNKIVVPEAASEHLSDFPEHHISMAMAIGIIDFLKIIQINQDTGKRPLAALVVNPVLNIFIQPLPIVDAGQVIGVNVLILNV